MERERTPPSGPDPDRLDRVVGQLCDHFAAGHLELDELERRLDRVEEAKSSSELDALLRGLPALERGGVADRGSAGVRSPAERRPAPEVESRGWALALLGGTSRKGRWTPPERLNAIAVMGGITLDFRDARFGAAGTEVTAAALMGGIDIIVPPDLSVEVRGLGILGSVDQVEPEADRSGSGDPRLRVTAVGCMGGVEVKRRPRSG